MSSVTQNLPQESPAPRQAFRAWCKKYEIVWWPFAIMAVSGIVLVAQHYSHLSRLVHH